MTYHPGIVPRLARETGEHDSPPLVTCDACGDEHVMRRSAPGRLAPLGWLTEYSADGITRRDLCPACRPAIRDEDIETHIWPPSRGGQQVGTPRGLIALHVPTQIGVVICEGHGYSAIKRRERAIELLRRLLGEVVDDNAQRTTVRMENRDG